jgi:hypothetical protein
MHEAPTSSTYIMRVQIVNRAQDLPNPLAHDAMDGVIGQAFGELFQLVQDGVIHVLKHEVQLALAPEHLDQVDNVLMP